VHVHLLEVIDKKVQEAKIRKIDFFEITVVVLTLIRLGNVSCASPKLSNSTMSPPSDAEISSF